MIVSAILLHKFRDNFCDGNYFVFFSLDPIELCHGLQEYCRDYFEQVVQRENV
jgi:hypothetical protein